MKVCGNPECSNELPPPARPGVYSRKYCSDNCRDRVRRQKERAERNTATAGTAAALPTSVTAPRTPSQKTTTAPAAPRSVAPKQTPRPAPARTAPAPTEPRSPNVAGATVPVLAATEPAAPGPRAEPDAAEPQPEPEDGWETGHAEALAQILETLRTVPLVSRQFTSFTKDAEKLAWFDLLREHKIGFRLIGDGTILDFPLVRERWCAGFTCWLTSDTVTPAPEKPQRAPSAYVPPAKVLPPGSRESPAINSGRKVFEPIDVSHPTGCGWCQISRDEHKLKCGTSTCRAEFTVIACTMTPGLQINCPSCWRQTETIRGSRITTDSL